MSDGIHEPVNDGDDGVIDLDQAFGEDGADILDTSYSPPERPRGLDAFGTTAEEEMRGESLDQRIAQEEPDPAMEVDGVLDDGEVGEARAGRLVDPDEGVREDTESDLVATDVGIDAGAASAEEAAMHVVDSEQPGIDEGSSR